MGVPSAKAGLEDMALRFDYLEVYLVLDKVGALVTPTLSECVTLISR